MPHIELSRYETQADDDIPIFPRDELPRFVHHCLPLVESDHVED